MIYVGSNCDKCKRKLSRIDGWRSACEAFPEGIPLDFDGNQEGEECNNGIVYDPDPDLVKVFDFAKRV